MEKARYVGNDGGREGGTGGTNEQCVASLSKVDGCLVSIASGCERRQGPVDGMIAALPVSESIPPGTAPNDDKETVQEHNYT